MLHAVPCCVQFGDLSTLRPEEDRIKPESNGSIIAVSYEARKHGVKRYDPEVIIQQQQQQQQLKP
jgi:nucleotidyltransferase/DNA polymerase involved in DNA repair